MKNTYYRGTLNLFMYREKNKYIGVCLDLDIVLENSTPQELKEELIDAVQNYVETVIENKLSESLLNKPAPQKYWNKFHKYIRALNDYQKKKISIGTTSVITIPITKDRTLTPVC